MLFLPYVHHESSLPIISHNEKGGTFWPDILDNQQIPKLTSKPAETFIEIKLYK